MTTVDLTEQDTLTAAWHPLVLILGDIAERVARSTAEPSRAGPEAEPTDAECGECGAET